LYFEDGQDSENKYIRNNIADKIITMLKNKNVGSITTQQLFDDCNKGAIPVCYTTNCDIKDQRRIEDISNKYEIVLATEEYKLIEVNFTYKDVSHYFSIAVEDEDFIVGIGDFDVHYCEDYNSICVYPVIDGKVHSDILIHQQTINENKYVEELLTEYFGNLLSISEFAKECKIPYNKEGELNKILGEAQYDWDSAPCLEEGETVEQGHYLQKILNKYTKQILSLLN
jgi:hypothetical protein